MASEEVLRGDFSNAEAAAVRAEGERVVTARPWPTGWEEWRPDPEWTLPSLPDDWHTVDRLPHDDGLTWGPSVAGIGERGRTALDTPSASQAT